MIHNIFLMLYYHFSPTTITYFLLFASVCLHEIKIKASTSMLESTPDRESGKKFPKAKKIKKNCY